MLKNYFKTAIRNIIRYKGYSILNILGLALGITCFLFIFLYVQYELSYDQYHAKKENIYRIVTESYIGTPAPLLPACLKDIPEVINGSRMRWVAKSSGRVFKYNNNMFNEKKYFQADPAFFEIFSFNFIKGNPKTALIDPNSIVITETIAEKYFGKEDPVGKVLACSDQKNYMVTGVVKDVPENSHFQFDFMGQFPQDIGAGWGMYNYMTYILVADNSKPNVVLSKMGDIFKKNVPKSTTKPFLLQKLTDIHLKSHIRGEIGQNGFYSNIYLYSAIAFIVLLIACINYTNLVTAQYSKRTNEIGIRKVIGANRQNIIRQFMTETLIFISVAIICSLLLYKILSPMVNDVLGKQLNFSQLGGWKAAIGLFGVAFLTAVISGSYPAFYLSSLNPINIMKESSQKVIKVAMLRKALLVLQFSFSIFFLILTILISQQMNLFNNKKLGFDKEHILNINVTGNYEPRFETIKKELLKYPEIRQASFNQFLLSGNDWNQTCWWEGLAEKDYDHGMRWVPVDKDFINTFQLKITQGTSLPDNNTRTSYILNESALKYMGIKKPVGMKFEIMERGPVVGVVEDFHTKSLRDSIVPCALVILPEVGPYLSVRLAPGNIPNTINKIKNLWYSVFPDRPFDYFFFDEDYNALYKEEQKTAEVFGYAAILSIVISFLGLFALISLTIEQKTKEIAMRKVLGASVSNIVVLLSKDYSKMILAANLISWPVAYYFTKKWLEDFAYKIDIGLLSFLTASIGALLLALLIVGIKAIKASLANPVNSLKRE